MNKTDVLCYCSGCEGLPNPSVFPDGGWFYCIMHAKTLLQKQLALWWWGRGGQYLQPHAVAHVGEAVKVLLVLGLYWRIQVYAGHEFRHLHSSIDQFLIHLEKKGKEVQSF